MQTILRAKESNALVGFQVEAPQCRGFVVASVPATDEDVLAELSAELAVHLQLLFMLS
jgi:hypothetical protein